MKILLIFLTATCLLFSTCVSKECQRTNYQFEIPVTLSPALDTFRINDTISVISSFSDMVYERIDNRAYHLEDIQFYPSLFVSEISGTQANEGALDFFEVLVPEEVDFQVFSSSTGLVNYEGQYLYQDNRYELTYQLVPKQEGLYFLEQGSRLALFGEDQTFVGKCKNLGMDAKISLNERICVNFPMEI